MVKDLSTSYNENGKPMFTLTSYLVLVWRSLAKCNGSTVEETSVTFKNVSVIKNKKTPTSEDNLQVTLLPVSGDFEVCQDGGIVVTGNAKILEHAKEAKITLPYIPVKEAVLNTGDIYEDLNKRGYTTDSHKCIKSSDINTAVGYITWVDWTSFIDAMFQFDLLGKNTEAYLSPKHIETLNIDTKSHETVCLEHRDLPVYNHKTVNVIVAGGVQISGIKWDKMHNDLEVKFQTQTLINGQLETVDEIQKELDHAHLEVSPGDLASLRWVESPPLWPTPGKEVCQVYYVGLNQQDLEIAYGKPLSEDQLGDVKNHQRHLGTEFSGRTSTGKRVMGIVQRGLATTVLADKRFLWEVPSHWSLSNAAMVPVAFSTAYYALVIRGRIKAKQTVVVYNGVNDIGLAMIALAIRYGCNVYCTYGNNEQQNYISFKFLEMPSTRIGQHWDPTFEKMILERTEGRGADLILNQLGADKIPTALGCLAAGGRLLNIGDEDLSRIEGGHLLKPNKSMQCINMDSLSEDSWLKVADLLSEGIRQGHVNPMEMNCFSKDIGHIREAFESLSAPHGVGKTVIRIQQEERDGQTLMLKSILASPRPHVDALHSYVLTGGSDDMVMEMGQWLVSRGATKLVISLTDEYISGYLLWAIERWRQQGIKVLVTDKNTYSQEGAKKLLEEASALGAVGGVFDMTAVQEENDNFEGIEILDKVTREAGSKLKYFVILSCLQQNQQRRDSLVRIVQSRKRSKLPGLVIDLGTVIGPQKADDYIASEYPSNNIRIAMKNLDNLLVQPYDMVTCAEV